MKSSRIDSSFANVEAWIRERGDSINGMWTYGVIGENLEPQYLLTEEGIGLFLVWNIRKGSLVWEEISEAGHDMIVMTLRSGKDRRPEDDEWVPTDQARGNYRIVRKKLSQGLTIAWNVEFVDRLLGSPPA